MGTALLLWWLSEALGLPFDLLPIAVIGLGLWGDGAAWAVVALVMVALWREALWMAPLGSAVLPALATYGLVRAWQRAVPLRSWWGQGSVAVVATAVLVGGLLVVRGDLTAFSPQWIDTYGWYALVQAVGALLVRPWWQGVQSRESAGRIAWS